MPPMEQLVVTPEDATFSCTAEGLPRPSITWFTLLDESPQELLADSVFSIDTVDGAGEREVTSTLTINNTQPAVSGTYICNATNEVNTATAMTTLTVHSKSRIPHIPLHR